MYTKFRLLFIITLSKHCSDAKQTIFILDTKYITIKASLLFFWECWRNFAGSAKLIKMHSINPSFSSCKLFKIQYIYPTLWAAPSAIDSLYFLCSNSSLVGKSIPHGCKLLLDLYSHLLLSLPCLSYFGLPRLLFLLFICLSRGAKLSTFLFTAFTVMMFIIVI